MKTFVGFDFYTSHTRVSGDLCLSTIIEGISNAIDKFRDAYRLYRVMGLSNNVQDMKSYALDVGVVKAHINIGDDNSHVSFDLTDTIISDMLQSYDFKSRGLSYTGLLDNLDVYIQIYKGNVINVILPSTISYVITETVPGIKGNRAQSGTKPATIETGMEIQVPLHKEVGDTVTLNTLTGGVN